MKPTTESLEAKFNEVAGLLKNSQNEHGYWDGQLSSSALGVAVSVIAFQFYDSVQLKDEIDRGVQWLIANVNADGGFGDTPQSKSNISTSLLCYSALKITVQFVGNTSATILRLATYLKQNGIDVQSNHFAQHVIDFYQKDYTFSVPILATCAFCGIPENNPFKNIPQLPFELALLPRRFYRFFNLNVVSYAIPALVSMGIAIFQHKPSCFILRGFRKKMIPKAINLLDRLLPQSGGFLEAIPLTAFVSLSLIKAGFQEHRVVQKGIVFLKRIQRNDGSWPIDIDLSTWVTTLSIKSFRNQIQKHFDQNSVETLTTHLLSVQNQSVHPFNGTTPGGWGWTHFSGSVPDGDDTPSAIVALLLLHDSVDKKVAKSVLNGCDWLLKLQNNDGGFPTFSRGWGKLPFDESCSDLTGHVFLALAICIEKLGQQIKLTQRKSYERALKKAARYLIENQKPDGSWLPLWFGNQDQRQQNNPVYGTARVCAYILDALTCKCVDYKLKELLQQVVSKAQNYLLAIQNQDGSWGGDQNIAGTIEETSLALSALAGITDQGHTTKGIVWLEGYIAENGFKSSPIGLYFASLWYDEMLYPLTMYAEMLARMKEVQNI